MRPSVCRRPLAVAPLVAALAIAFAIAVAKPALAGRRRITAFSRHQSGSAHLIVMQYGRRVAPDARGRVTLAAHPFTIVVTVPRGGRGVMLNASPNGALFARARAGRPLGSRPPFAPGSGMAEHSFNRDKELFTSDSGSHYLYIDLKHHDHRFSHYRISGGQLRGYRVVDKTWDVATKKRTPMRLWRGKNLYLVARVGTAQREQWRAYLRLRFR